VFRIAINGIRDFGRERSRRLEREASLEEVSEKDLLETHVTRHGVDGIASGRDQTAALATFTEALLAEMSPREREVITRTAKGLSDSAIAAELDVNVNAVRAARCRARARSNHALRDIAPTLDEIIHRKLRKLLR
jgi:DNA-directed RNA polymerase specialized sigma24 family protein